MASQFCFSCTAPLSNPEFRGPAENYCRYCTNEAGALLDREQVQQCIAQWLQSWQPDMDEREALRRAELFMRAMPAWA